MCLLIVSENKFPSTEVLTLANTQNPHGAGIAWAENGKVRWKKGITLSEVLALKDQVEGKPHIIHFRYATVGGKRNDLCHPFAIDEDATTSLEGETDKVLAHNGHWSGYSKDLYLTLDHNTQLPSGPWSDTRAMAWLAHVKGVNFLETIREKIAVLTGEGEITVFQKHLFHKHNDLMLSYDPFSRIRLKNDKTSSSCMNGRNSWNTKTYQDWSDTNSVSPPINIKTGKLISNSANFKEKANYSGYKLPDTVDM